MKDEYTIPCSRAAKRVGVSKLTLMRRAKNGKLDARRKGAGRYFFRPADIEDLRKLYKFGEPVTA